MNEFPGMGHQLIKAPKDLIDLNFGGTTGLS